MCVYLYISSGRRRSILVSIVQFAAHMISVCLQIAQKQMMNFNVFVEREQAIKCAPPFRPIRCRATVCWASQNRDNDEHESTRFSFKQIYPFLTMDTAKTNMHVRTCMHIVCR